MKKSIGIDVSKRTLDFAYEVENGKFQSSSEKNTKTGIHHYLRQNGFTPENSRFVMESTGTYNYQLAVELTKLGYETYVVNPLRIKRYAESEMYRAKTDTVDARIIAKYAVSKARLTPFILKNKVQMEIDCVSKTIGRLKKDRTKYYNRIEGLKNLDSTRIIQTQINMINAINREIKELEKEVKLLIDNEFSETYELLTSIKGIGPINACAIIGRYGNFETFENAKQVVAYAGLNPSPYESGTSVKKRGSISKQGHNYMRQLLYMGALTAKRLNPQCRNLAKRLEEKNKSHRYIMTAIAQKLLRQAFGVVKNKKYFEENYVKTS